MNDIMGQGQYAETSVGQMHRESLSVRLTRQKNALGEQLKKVNEALNLLEKNPDLQKLLDVVSEVG